MELFLLQVIHTAERPFSKEGGTVLSNYIVYEKIMADTADWQYEDNLIPKLEKNFSHFSNNDRTNLTQYWQTYQK